MYLRKVVAILSSIKNKLIDNPRNWVSVYKRKQTCHHCRNRRISIFGFEFCDECGCLLDLKVYDKKTTCIKHKKYELR